MAEVIPKMMTFDEFAELNSEGRYELVNGRLEELVAPRPLHGWTFMEFLLEIGPYLREHDPGHYRGAEVDVPTIPFHGRRPDFVYYASGAGGIDLTRDRVYSPPTLAVEVVSEGDEERDLVVKLREYAQAGIPHYWIIDPVSQTVTTYVLLHGQYEVATVFRVGESLTSELFPGLAIPLARLFPQQ